jgi:hypothetical protein
MARRCTHEGLQVRPDEQKQVAKHRVASSLFVLMKLTVTQLVTNIYNPKHITSDYSTLDIRNMRRPTKRNICAQSRAGLWPSEVLSSVKTERPQNFERQNLYLLLTLEGTLKLKMKLIWMELLQLCMHIYKDDCVKLRWTALAQYISLNIKIFKFCHSWYVLYLSRWASDIGRYHDCFVVACLYFSVDSKQFISNCPGIRSG